MSGLESLYQQLILDHAKAPNGRGFRDVDAGLPESFQRNPLCGDEITLRVRLDGDRVDSVAWEGTGCSISQASASMLVDLLDGATRDEAVALVGDFREAMRSRGKLELDVDRFGDAAALSGVSKFSSRVKCAMLAWVAFEDALTRS